MGRAQRVLAKKTEDLEGLCAQVASLQLQIDNQAAVRNRLANDVVLLNNKTIFRHLAAIMVANNRTHLSLATDVQDGDLKIGRSE
jgi:hypothetical protein